MVIRTYKRTFRIYKKARKHILVGFSENVKVYRIYNPVKNQVTTSRDVVILEKKKQEDKVNVCIENTDSVGESMEESVLKSEPSYQTSLSDSESEYLDVGDGRSNLQSAESSNTQITLQTERRQLIHQLQLLNRNVFGRKLSVMDMPICATVEMMK